MLDYLVLAFSILYIPLLPFAVVAGVILFFRKAAHRKERELLRRYNIPPPEYLNPSTLQLEGFSYEGEREAANPSGAQPEPAGLTPNEEGFGDAHRDPSNQQPSPAAMAEQLVRLLNEHPGLLEKPGVNELLLAVSEAAVGEFRSLGLAPSSVDDILRERTPTPSSETPSDSSELLRRLRRKRRAELLALAKRGGR